MNMIRINFIPQQLRRRTGNFWAEGFGSLPREVILGAFVGAAMILAVVHVLLAGVALAKVAQHTLLEVRWGALSPKKKVLDDVINQTKEVQTKISALKVIAIDQGVVWAKLLNEVSDSVPNGAWLRDVLYIKGVLTIEGSAVSKVRNEMIIVNNFVAALKEKPLFKSGFVGIDVDSIEGRKDTALSIADFVLKARLKADLKVNSKDNAKTKGKVK